MFFVLIIFTDVQRTAILKMLKFKTMKQIIELTDNKINYYDVRRQYHQMKYQTKKSIYEVVKVRD